VLGHIQSQRIAKLQIFTCWSLFALTVGAVRWEDAVRSRFLSSDGPPFRHLHHDGLKRYDSLWLAGVSHAPTYWDVGSSHLRAVLDLPLRKPRLHHRLVQHASPSQGGTCLAHPSEEESPPSALGHPATSTTRHLRFAPSPH